jgi:hypothetical protein
LAIVARLGFRDLLWLVGLVAACEVCRLLNPIRRRHGVLSTDIGPGLPRARLWLIRHALQQSRCGWKKLLSPPQKRTSCEPMYLGVRGARNCGEHDVSIDEGSARGDWLVCGGRGLADRRLSKGHSARGIVALARAAIRRLLIQTSRSTFSASARAHNHPV